MVYRVLSVRFHIAQQLRHVVLQSVQSEKDKVTMELTPHGVVITPNDSTKLLMVPYSNIQSSVLEAPVEPKKTK